MRVLLILFAFSAISKAQADVVASSSPQPQQSSDNPMGRVFSLFQGFGQNIQQTFTGSRPSPGYLASPAGNSSEASSPGILMDLMNRAKMINGSALLTAVRERMDRVADNNVVIMRISELFRGQNRTKRQSAEAKPSETIDDVVKRLRESNTAPAADDRPGHESNTSPFFGISSKLFEGLDGLIGMGSISGDGMTGVLQSISRLLDVNESATGHKHADQHDRVQSMRHRFEERRRERAERRQEWEERRRIRDERRRNVRREKEQRPQTPEEPVATDGQEQPAHAEQSETGPPQPGSDIQS